MQHLLFGGDLRHRLRDARVDVADDELYLVAVDQLARLLYAGADVICGIFNEQFQWTTENAAFGIDLLDSQFGADDFVIRHRGISARQRIDHADPDGVGCAHRNDEWRRNLRYAGRQRGLDERTAIKFHRSGLVFHLSPPTHLYVPPPSVHIGQAAIRLDRHTSVSW